jgi:hypothetical protein
LVTVSEPSTFCNWSADQALQAAFLRQQLRGDSGQTAAFVAAQCAHGAFGHIVEQAHGILLQTR